ncbi:MAG: alpha-galactosidase [Planctomycetota bacterium]
MTDDVFARQTGQRFIIGNALIEREFDIRNGALATRRITDKLNGYVWDFEPDGPDIAIPGETGKSRGGHFASERIESTAAVGSYLQVHFEYSIGTLSVRQSFKIFPDSPAILNILYLKGTPTGDWGGGFVNVCDAGNVENTRALALGTGDAPTIERLALPGVHHRFTASEFLDITDFRDNLYIERAALAYRADTQLKGNALIIRDPLKNRALFVIKDSPPANAQIAYPGCDFIIRIGSVRTVGIGLTPSDVKPDEWTRCYGVATGVSRGEPLDSLKAVRRFTNCLRVRKPGRDEMIMLNTWGDRGQDKHVGESFANKELDAAETLGVTHFQLDDGWQTGRTSNSAFKGGSLTSIWSNPDYWKPNPERFAKGLAPIAALAKSKGIELCLWFNPSSDDEYANWRKDADSLISLNREYGIRTFKIDGVWLKSARATENFRRFLDAVRDATANDVVFNLDVTAGRRWGYHHVGIEYGNIFLENRYTDWGNYYPHRTLRNLWQLSKFIPPQSLQIEFLNIWRNESKYPADDPLAPSRIPFDYCFAIAMPAQPLAWFEASNLPPHAFEIAPLIHAYRNIMHDVHSGMIFPIGDEPDGTSWTGFQSLKDNGGYLFIYRELNERDTAAIRLLDVAGKTIQLTRLMGNGKDGEQTVSETGEATFTLPSPFQFSVYRYTIV